MADNAPLNQPPMKPPRAPEAAACGGGATGPSSAMQPRAPALQPPEHRLGAASHRQAGSEREDLLAPQPALAINGEMVSNHRRCILRGVLAIAGTVGCP